MDWDNDDVRARDRSVRNVVSPLDWKLDLILPLSFSANVLSFLTKTSRLPPFCIRSVYLRSLSFLFYALFAVVNVYFVCNTQLSNLSRTVVDPLSLVLWLLLSLNVRDGHRDVFHHNEYP